MRVVPSRYAAKPLYAWVLVGLCTLSLTAGEPRRKANSPWEPSVVTIEVSCKQYDYYQPWVRKNVRLQKPGIVVGDREILTTADDLFNRTLLRLQRGGRGPWSSGKVSWIDYYANLALITTDDVHFWRGLRPATLGGAIPADGSLQVLRWRGGNFESRRADFTRFSVREGQLAAVNQAVLEADSDIQDAGWGEPVVAGSRVVGLMSSQDGRTCVAIPASFIRAVLAAQQKGQYRGLGYFHFYWQPAQNLASLARLKLTGDPRGVLVIDVPDRPDGLPPVLKPQDIILQVDGFNIDIQGDYLDPEYGELMLENLATRGKWAGDEVKMRIWRDGAPLEVAYRLPRYAYSTALVPLAKYDRDPEYLIVGGLVFQPLTEAYLRSWGADWRRRAPFRLLYYRGQPPTKDRSALVLLSQVLPDPFNIGYQQQNYLVVDRVNGQKISRLEDLQRALAHPESGYHVIDFVQSDSLRRMVLRAGPEEQQATRRVLKRYGIVEASHFDDAPAP